MKLQKSKKSRNRVPIEKEEEEPAELSSTSEEQRPAENVSLLEEFERVATLASSSSGEAIISHECCISSDVGVTPQEPEGTQEPTETEAQPSAPSAPPSTTVHVVQYPNLQPMQLSNAQVEEHSAKIVYRQAESPTGFALARSHIKPLSTEELRQIYDCPELELAKQFELEFLMNSLLETSEADPLYAAVMEYYELQGKITSNLHDVEKLRKGCAESQKQIWVRQPVTRTFSGTCGDGNVVQECVTYE